MKIAFIGAGRWAVALSLVLHRKGNEIKMWEYSEERLKELLKTRTLPDLPANISIPTEIEISNDLEYVLQSAQIIFFAIPSQALRSVLTKMSPFRFNTQEEKVLIKRPILVSAIKGLENNTNKRMSQIIKEFFPDLKVVVLAGPGIPYELAEGKPTSLVAASTDTFSALDIQTILSDQTLRVYTHHDVVGVELGGALKNIIAIAAGICDGLKLGDNAKSALITRGLAEITRLGVAMNANPLTFAGLSGIGDIIVTSYSRYSRNRLVGEMIAQGKEIKELERSLSGIAEGISTIVSARALGAKMRLELPIIEEMHAILYQGADINKSIKKLMERTLKKEM